MQKLVAKAFNTEDAGDTAEIGSSGEEARPVAADPAKRLLASLADTSVPRPAGPLANALKVLDHADSEVSKHSLIHAVVTNPPFYTAEEVIERNPRTVCTGSLVEMVTRGGEVAFVGAIVADSLILRDKITWYTATLGKKSSLNPLLALLIGLRITNVRTVRFMGGSTTRWGVAWSFTARGAHMLPKAGQSADPKIIDIACLNKCLGVKTFFDIAYDDVLETTLTDENEHDARTSTVGIVSARVRRAFTLLTRSDSTWNYGIKTQEVSATRGSVDVSGKSSSPASASIPDLDMCVAINVTGKGKVIHVEFNCTCASVSFVAHARHASDIIKMEIQRSNRKWRREIAKNREGLSEQSRAIPS